LELFLGAKTTCIPAPPRLGKRGAKLVGEVVQYEDTYRLFYIRGLEGILAGLAQELGQQSPR
jgi:hypothetical protein